MPRRLPVVDGGSSTLSAVAYAPNGNDDSDGDDDKIIPLWPPAGQWRGRRTCCAALAAALPSGAVVAERDQLFSEMRRGGAKLGDAKSATHAALAAAVRRAVAAGSVCAVDSGNAARAGREYLQAIMKDIEDMERDVAMERVLDCY